MKTTIFSSLSYQKLLNLLQSHTASSRKETADHVWTTKKNSDKEWACLVGRWEGDTFKGKLYRHYNDQTSGGLAIPHLTLKVSSAGSLGQIQFHSGFSFSLWIVIAVCVIVALLQVYQVVSTLPVIKPIPVLVLIGWILLSIMMLALFNSQYQHEREAVEYIIKDMTKSFDKN